ncbi:MAG: hypothetical protein MUC29_14140, partial [Pyrinomonadaceae bacterium]|nr:hypothetical protein [Pyrinomonadaceae bacterium]
MRNLTPSFLVIVLLVVILNLLPAKAQTIFNQKNIFLYNHQYNFDSELISLDLSQENSFHTKTGENIPERVVFEILFFRVTSL